MILSFDVETKPKYKHKHKLFKKITFYLDKG